MAKLAPRRPQLRPNAIAFSLEFQVVPPTLFEQPLFTVKGASVQEEIIDRGLLVFPQLGWRMLAEGIDKAVGVEHREPFRVRAIMIPRFAVSQVCPCYLTCG